MTTLSKINLNLKANPLGRIVNGDRAENYQFPWHVSLRITQTTSEITYCGGSIIAANFVLTTAACLKNARTIQVDIGSIVFTTPFETQHTTQFQVHPQYSEDFKLNNIAIIRLQTTLVFRTNIRAILLPRIRDQSELYESADSYASGFGVTQAGSNYLSNELRYAHKTVISNDNCRQSFDSRFIPNTVMCATGHNSSTQSLCYGDQGGALVSHVDGSWLQIGVSSVIHSLGCLGTAPAGYTRVTAYLQWISSLTGIVLRP